MNPTEMAGVLRVTARAVRWLENVMDGDITTCVCGRDVYAEEYDTHAETCRALRREVE